MKIFLGSKDKFRLKPKIIITVAVAIFIIMAMSSYYELGQSKKEIFSLLSENASSLVETISLCSQNTLSSNYQMEDLIAERLMNNARLIAQIDSTQNLTKNDLHNISIKNNLFRICIYNIHGQMLNSISNTNNVATTDSLPIYNYKQLKPILTGETKELVLGMQNVKNSEDQRYAVAVARSKNRGAIVIYLDANEFLEFRKKTGIGKVMQEIGKNNGVEYILLQDTLGILAASTSIDSINSISSDSFLMAAMQTDSIKMRINSINNKTVYEVVKRFYYDGELIGVFRIGLSLDELHDVENSMTKRVLILSLILGLLTLIVFSIVFISQNLKIVTEELSRIKTFTGSILENLGDAVVVINDDFIITLCNKYAEELFNIKADIAVGQKAEQVIPLDFHTIINSTPENINSKKEFENTVIVNGKELFLYINVTINTDVNNLNSFTFVIRNLTDYKRLEEQSKRDEKLSAMGELASGVAHEIRNPINSIGMIAQRLKKEFIPKNETEDYFNILTVLKNEVARINKIITQFLNYSKPYSLNLKECRLDDFIEEIYNIFINHTKIKDAVLSTKCDKGIIVLIDAELLKQALLNILQNSLDAISENGIIEIECIKDNDFALITIKDNGVGIPENRKENIFNLYFTSKKDGNGLGLSITQKIISEHNGEISFTSKENFGTTFIIKLPTV